MTPSDASSNQLHDQSKASASLARVLGSRIAIAVVVGNVIGSGIYLKPGVIAGEGLAFPAIMMMWAFGGALCVLGALSFAELATMLPRAGGLYVYLRESYGAFVGFLFGWTEFLIRIPGSIAALAVAFVTSLMPFLGISSLPMWLQVVLCAFVILSLAWVNVMGVLWGGRLQMVFTVLKVATLVMVIVAPLALTPFVEEGLDLGNYSTTKTTAEDGAELSKSLVTKLGVVLLAIMWAYNGWHGITPLAEEIREPQRNIPIALFGGIGILILLYMSANFAYHSVLTMDEMATAGTQASTRMLDKLIGPIGGQFVAIVIMCSTFGAINTNLLQAPRIPFAMGRDRMFFKSLGTVHANYRTPAASIIATAGMAIALITIGALAQWVVQNHDLTEYEKGFALKIMSSLQKGELFNLLTDFVIFAASIFYALTVSAVIILRMRRPDLDRPYRVPAYPFVPIVFIVIYVWFLSQILIEKPLEALVGLAFIASGVPVFAMFRKASDEKPGR